MHDQHLLSDKSLLQDSLKGWVMMELGRSIFLSRGRCMYMPGVIYMCLSASAGKA